MPLDAVVNVSGWVVLGVEVMGSKPDKIWLGAPDPGPFSDGKWLFKPRTWQREEGRQFAKGDDWAEKVVSQVAQRLSIPAAQVEFAQRSGVLGIISRDVSGDRNLVLGNVVLADQDPDYPGTTQLRDLPGYTVEAVFGALRALGVTPPPSAGSADACSTFAGYLLLDALVANTDRHHGNWGILESTSGEAPKLAATFDHASSLGFQLADRERSDRLDTRDVNRTVDAYAERGECRYFFGRPRLVELASRALGLCGGDSIDLYRARLESLDTDALNELVDRVPAERMSHPLP